VREIVKRLGTILLWVAVATLAGAAVGTVAATVVKAYCKGGE
jgi:hypothetical protein